MIATLRSRRIPRWSQLRYLPRLLSVRERRALLSLMVLLLASVGTLTVRAWQRATDLVPVAGGTYVEGLVGSPQYINPLLSASNDVDRDLASLLFCGLLRLDAAGQLVPDAAEQVALSSDNLTYTITLRPDARWHDGAPVTMDDVTFTIGTLQEDTFGSLLAGVWSEVQTQVVNEQVIELKLPRPFPDFRQALTVGLLPAHLWRDIPVANFKLTPLNVQPVGCGPFAFESFTRDRRGTIRSLSVRRHDAYHGRVPYLDRLTFKFYPDYDTAVAALRNGNIGGLGSLPAASVQEIAGRRSIVLHRLTIPQYTAAFFNMRGSTALRQREVRQALAAATNRQKIVEEALAGQGQLLDGPVLPVPMASVVPGGAANAEAARTFLTNGGWKQEDGAWRKASTTLTVKVLAADRPEHIVIVNRLKQDWEALGVPTEVELVPRISLRERVRTGSFDTIIFSESLGISGNPLAFWHSSQAGVGGLNISGWANREADALLEQARSAADAAQRRELLARFQDLIIGDQPALFLYSPIYIYPVTAVVKGIRAEKLGVPADRFSGVSGWYIKTKRTL